MRRWCRGVESQGVPSSTMQCSRTRLGDGGDGRDPRDPRDGRHGRHGGRGRAVPIKALEGVGGGGVRGLLAGVGLEGAEPLLGHVLVTLEEAAQRAGALCWGGVCVGCEGEGC